MSRHLRNAHAPTVLLVAIFIAVGCSGRRAPLQNQNTNITDPTGSMVCVITPDANIAPGDAYGVQVVMTGGKSPYNMLSFSAGSNGTVLTTPVFNGITSAAVRVSYSAAGTPTLSAKVGDTDGLLATCTKSITVAAPVPPLPEPVGYFRIGNDGFFADTAKNFCHVISGQDWVNRGAPDFNTVPVYTQLSNKMKPVGDCAPVPPPVVNQPPPPPPDPTGFFVVGSGLYVANLQKHYCQIVSGDQWITLGGGDINAAPRYPAIPASMIPDGHCRVPGGFFQSSGGLFLANNEGGFCNFISPAHYFINGGPAGPVPNYTPFPNSMTYLKECGISRPTFFQANGALMWANGQGAACHVPSIPQWFAMGGTNPPQNADVYPYLPNTTQNVGDCPIPAVGFFMANGGAFFSGSNQHFCGFSSLSQWTAAGGGDMNAVPNFTPFPNGNMVYDGECNVAKSDRVIYRLVNSTNGDYLHSGGTTEGTPRYTYQGPAFSLYGAQVQGTVPLMRCIASTAKGDRHFLSNNGGCEGQKVEGPMGFLFMNQVAGTRPLHRLRNTNTRAFLSTADPNEAALRGAWEYVGVIGYVY